MAIKYFCDMCGLEVVREPKADWQFELDDILLGFKMWRGGNYAHAHPWCVAEKIIEWANKEHQAFLTMTEGE